ncbi:MAG: hypothetical protein ACYDBT_07555 [Desulfobulbaceae bacterium]
MMKRKLILFIGACLVVGLASSAFAAETLKRLGTNPFSPPMTSEADLRDMVRNNSADLQSGFGKAGSPELFAAFTDQFPTAAVDTIRVAPGERLNWMLFRKNKGKGQVTVLKDVTWGGAEPFEAYRFYIDRDGRRYEFVVPVACGNLSLRSSGPVPVKAAVVPPPAPVVVPEPVKEPEVVEERRGGPVVDIGVSRMFDPATYAFGRVGYEYFFAENWSAMGLIGGFVRFEGDDYGDAFTADALLNYYFTEKMFVGGGVGLWAGDETQADLILNMGYLVYENPSVMRASIFIEGRCEADNLTSSNSTRLGAGVRFQF